MRRVFIHISTLSGLRLLLSRVGHLEMWRILAREYEWAKPLLLLARRVLCFPAREAHSERAISQIHRIFREARCTNERCHFDEPYEHDDVHADARV
jgi:hypothetical protein